MGKELCKVVIKGKGTFSTQQGESVLSVLRKHNLLEFSNCGGNGTCGKCVVRFMKGAPLPLPGDRRKFSPAQLRDGFRLACLAKPQQDCILELHFAQDDAFILTESTIALQSSQPEYSPLDRGVWQTDAKAGSGKGEKEAEGAQYASQVVVKVDPQKYGDTFIIADLGTTTIVMQLIEKQTGTAIDTYSTLNPQRRFGADVVSRIQQSVAGNRLLLSECVEYCLECGAEKWVNAGFSPEVIVIAGNTVMTHLLMGYDVSGLAKAPFEPVSTSQLSMQIGQLPAVIMPGISAFVGGDIVAGILACREKMKEDGVSHALLLDLGTNGEMAVIGPDRILCTSTAAGPAFEGGATANVPGSDMIWIVWKLLAHGIVDETGLIEDAFFHQGVTVDGVVVRQEDIRGLQIAKAAVFAGIRILLKEYGIAREEVEHIYLAGGFGYKLSVSAACGIGLIPGSMEERTCAVGNTALAGAYLYGCRYLEGEKEPAGSVIQSAQTINLAMMDEFNDIYVHAMELRKEG